MINTTRSFVCLLFFVGAALSSAQAQLVHDPFAYTTGTTLAGQQLGTETWTALNTGAAPTIVAGSLSVAGLASSSGNSVSLPGGNYQEALLNFTSTTSGTIFFSLALNVTAAPTGASYVFGLSTGNTNYGATVWLQASGAGYQVGISNRSNSTVSYDSTVHTLGETVFLVGSYSFVAGAGNDVSSLWVNPASATFADAAAPTATASAAGGTDMTAVNQFLVRGAAGSPISVFDELRVGTTWAAVTPAGAPIPEPSTYAVIFGALALGVVVWRRRHARAV